jgi:exosome complex component CSL4
MKKKTVLPGDFLSTEEEFEPGRNAFLDEGDIVSDAIGEPVEDGQRKTVSVQAQKPLVVVRRDDIVLGKVETVRDNSITLSIMPEPVEKGKKVLTHGRASLPIRMVSRDFVEKLSDMFRIGDWIRAKVAKVEPAGIDLRTDEPGLGVIRAYCTKCRQPLQLFGSQLKCLSCGRTEGRKISDDYSLK